MKTPPSSTPTLQASLFLSQCDQDIADLSACARVCVGV